MSNGGNALISDKNSFSLRDSKYICIILWQTSRVNRMDADTVTNLRKMYTQSLDLEQIFMCYLHVCPVLAPVLSLSIKQDVHSTDMKLAH